ncbi:hypothetical protein FACS189479_06730 [Spirochaetia bacterium]|nr:hypothetical protein FACS189479_06730 [Spirochaetia bacterium]
MKTRQYLFSLIIILFLTYPLSSQSSDLDLGDLGDTTPRLMLALTTVDYPATPGDVYNLSYAAAGGVTVPLTLDAGYQLKIQDMGTVNARNKTYLQVRREVESLVSRNYPMSGPAFILVRMGGFNVMVSGEITVAGNRSVDGLTRISDLVAGMGGLSAKASSRRVMVTSAVDKETTYDLFQFQRYGTLEQNPYVKPGDRITSNFTFSRLWHGR